MVGHLSVWPVSPAGFAANGFIYFYAGNIKKSHFPIPYSDSLGD
jgi:hypothetical protein